VKHFGLWLGLAALLMQEATDADGGGGAPTATPEPPAPPAEKPNATIYEFRGGSYTGVGIDLVSGDTLTLTPEDFAKLRPALQDRLVDTGTTAVKKPAKGRK